MFISMFRSDIGMKLASVTWVYGRIPGLSWLFSKLIIPFQRRFFMSHIAPRWKNTTISIQKKLPPPPSSFHTSPTNAVAFRRGPVATCLRNHGLDGCGRSLWGSPFGRAPYGWYCWWQPEIRLHNQLRERSVVEVPLFTRFLHRPRWLFGISTINSSKAPYGWVVLLISAEGFLQIQTLLGGSLDRLPV